MMGQRSWLDGGSMERFACRTLYHWTSCKGIGEMLHGVAVGGLVASGIGGFARALQHRVRGDGFQCAAVAKLS